MHWSEFSLQVCIFSCQICFHKSQPLSVSLFQALFCVYAVVINEIRGEEETSQDMDERKARRKEATKEEKTQFPICEDVSGLKKSVKCTIWAAEGDEQATKSKLTIISRSQAHVTLRNSASALWSNTGQQYL